MRQLFGTSFETCFGRIGIEWKDRRGEPLITRVLLPEENSFTGVDASFPNLETSEKEWMEIRLVAGKIQKMLEGETVEFELCRIDLDACNPFQKKVLLAERGIPRGMISTYGRIARFIGCPKGARAVGNALSKNPFPLIIPCHRAVRADGLLGGFRGGLEMKRSLLRLEGVAVDDHDRVRTRPFFY
ncbi:MAG: methylated-DNA--[protein]-cysteine S-methyltransferase [Spirochaetes bacterium]|nr:methylated-DNA--[protein]-cysteine S-methyltransferase [Spirochaetota bacterium]